MEKFLVGWLVAMAIAYGAYCTRSLNASGAIAAGALGTIVLGLGGVGWAVILLTFYISSSLLSRVLIVRKVELSRHFAKGSRRDAGQVLANGGVAGVLALLYFAIYHLDPVNSNLPILWVGFAASFAGASTDTWATELGVLNPHQPVLLKTFKPVPAGTSGAVSLVGSLAALAGSALVGSMAVLMSRVGWAPALDLPFWTVFLAVTGAGVVGAFIDSLLGASLQAIYFCGACQKETERHPLHYCGTDTKLVRGWPWLNNDWVNAACTLSAALVGMLIVLILS
jgi:uncharacterized protein (TIGR00297 family)